MIHCTVLRKSVWIFLKLWVTRTRIQLTRVNFDKGKQNVVQVSGELERVFCHSSFAKHLIPKFLWTVSVVCSNCHQILNLVITHCCLVEDREKASKKLASLPHVQQESSSLCKPIILLLCGVSIGIAIAILVS